MHTYPEHFGLPMPVGPETTHADEVPLMLSNVTVNGKPVTH
jgi:hypothetical protein